MSDFAAERSWRAAQSRPKLVTSRIHLVPFEEIQLSTHRRDLVKGLIPRVGLSVIWGKPKCGKSFWLFDCLMHVALGWTYRGRRVHQGPVVYCAFEGQSGLEARVEAFRLTKLDGHTGRVPFYLMPVTLSLVKDHKALIKAIQSELDGETPVAIALDTLNRSLAGSESSDEDMSAYVQATDAIREAFECAVPVVHHCGIDGSRPRGHTSLTGAADAQIEVKRDSANRVIVEVELAKDGPQGGQIVSTLEVVAVGQDEDGEEITSCVVKACDDAALTEPKSRALRPEHRLALEALDAAILDSGQRMVTVETPAGVMVAHADDWKAELYRRGVLDKDHSNPSQQFKRLWQKLAAAQLLAQRDNQFWRG
ncbi:AAA family ATPase [Bradyrhizobium sp. UFLA03-84]|nr:AAA family ATPase [Bradyrhizobium sp. UFLA03-84]